jgi:hypothetical protein
MTSNVITSAGFALGVVILLVQHARWWGVTALLKTSGGGTAPTVGKKGAPAAPADTGGGKRDPVQLALLWLGIAFGTLMVACPAGLLGTAAGFLRWGGNGIGGTLMSGLTGHDAATVATASVPILDDNGAIIVTILVGVYWLLRKHIPKPIKAKMRAGIWCGALLGIGTGVFASIGNAVIPATNQLGAQLLGGLVHGTFV